MLQHTTPSTAATIYAPTFSFFVLRGGGCSAFCCSFCCLIFLLAEGVWASGCALQRQWKPSKTARKIIAAEDAQKKTKQSSSKPQGASTHAKRETEKEKPTTAAARKQKLKNKSGAAIKDETGLSFSHATP
jgi:hypothetical protein